MSARDRILGKLRAASVPPSQTLPDVASWYAGRQRGEDLTQRVARLRAALEAAHAELHDSTEQAWPEQVIAIAAAKQLRVLLVGDDSEDGRRLAARAADGPSVVPFDRPIEAWRDALFDDMDGAVTRAKGAIAETGSLILWPDAREPRTMSLVPPVHFVLLDVATIHADLHSAMAAENWAGTLPTNAVLVSGPSKTADIQQTLAYGAHGPRELVVLLIHGEEAGR